MLRFLTTIVASILCQETLARDPLDKAVADLNERIQALKARVESALVAEDEKRVVAQNARIEQLEKTVAGLDEDNRNQADEIASLFDSAARQRADYEAKINDLTKQLADLRPLASVGEAASAEAAAARKELHDANAALVVQTKLAINRLDEIEIARLKEHEAACNLRREREANLSHIARLKVQLPKEPEPKSDSVDVSKIISAPLPGEYSRAFRAAHEDAARTTAINSYLSRTFIRQSEGFIVVVSDAYGACRFGDEFAEGDEVGSVATTYPTMQAALAKLKKLREHFRHDSRLIRVDICDLASKAVVPVQFEP
jgi:hypothetical protein